MIYLVLLICLLVGSALTIVALQNLSTEVQFMLFIWSTPRIPLGLPVLVAFLLGALVLYIVSLLSAVQDRREVRRLRRRVSELERAAVRAPSGPLPKAPSGPLRVTGSSTTEPLPGVSSPPQT
jgi:uncharacterized integral membrane protein